ncbi:MAG: hypothetical protein Q7S22_00125 [Candidatus Micrarchaeota archaeon]|nr:hypothetical protein [Candidatus Micrarchaeota archaeon]
MFDKKIINYLDKNKFIFDVDYLMENDKIIIKKMDFEIVLSEDLSYSIRRKTFLLDMALLAFGILDIIFFIIFNPLLLVIDTVILLFLGMKEGWIYKEREELAGLIVKQIKKNADK